MDDLERERRALALFEALADLDDAGREALIAREAADDALLEARVRSLLAAERSAKLRTGGAWDFDDDEALPERIAAYRITARIGQGGMGSVYRGERAAGDFDHVVAIKVIKPGLLSEALTERFRRERQTLAQLAHPHIAQLFDGGEMPDGAPYIVMEHVDGQSLQRWVEETAPDKTARLVMFTTICRAVGFAHRNLVVHRDLTPSNVLVTRDGTPKLIDFGIAKAPDLDPDQSGATAMSRPSIGSLSLTPGYAAPERMTSAAVATAADIYSLGKLLGWLIPAQDAELKAIIARATAADPLARYATAEALAGDVEAWAGGLPVSAIEGGRGYVAGKFVRRHRLPLAAGALALALLVAALVYALIARAEAEARFEQTRSIAKTLLFETFDEVSKTPGSTRARQQLAETGLRYLDALAAIPNAPRDVRLEAGQGFLRLGEVVGGGQAGGLGRYKDGAALLAKAEELLKPLHEDAPDDVEVARAYAALLLEQSGTNLYNHGEIALARTQAKQAQAILEPLARRDARLAGLYLTALHAEGDTHEWEDDYRVARGIHERAEAFAAALPGPFQQAREVRVARSTNLRLLGEAYHKLKQPALALAVLDRGVALNRDLVTAAPDDPALLRKLINSLRYAAVVHRTNERDEAARQTIAEAATLAERLSARDPNDSGALHLLGLVKEVQAQVLADLKRFPESYKVGDAVIAAHRRIVALADNAAGARRSLAAALRTTGGNHYNGRDYAGACTLWREALGTYRDLDKAGALSDSDRKGSFAEMTDYVARACDKGGPNGALGTVPI